MAYLSRRYLGLVASTSLGSGMCPPVLCRPGYPYSSPRERRRRAPGTDHAAQFDRRPVDRDRWLRRNWRMDDQDRSNPIARARDLQAAIATASDATEATRRLPEPLIARLHEARLFRMLLPRSAGGDQIDPVNYLLAIEELSRHDGSTGWGVFVANSSALIAAYLEPGVARTIFADPCSTVAWGPPNASR